MSWLCYVYRLSIMWKRKDQHRQREKVSEKKPKYVSTNKWTYLCWILCPNSNKTIDNEKKNKESMQKLDSMVTIWRSFATCHAEQAAIYRVYLIYRLKSVLAHGRHQLPSAAHLDGMAAVQRIQVQSTGVVRRHELGPDVVLGKAMVHTQVLDPRGKALIEPQVSPPFLRKYTRAHGSSFKYFWVDVFKIKTDVWCIWGLVIAEKYICKSASRKTYWDFAFFSFTVLERHSSTKGSYALFEFMILVQTFLSWC